MLQPLRKIFKASDHPDLLVGLASADDAAVYRLNESEAIVTTTDFFPPVVDDPYEFGAIAAANALSDIYAMGGKPLFAINLVAFPDELNMDYLREILRGGAEKVAEAEAVIAGGHSVSDKEPKYGLAVTGIVHPKEMTLKGDCKPGDLLVLTKSLGTGVITTALKQQVAAEEHVAQAITSMMKLNRSAAQAARKSKVTSATDITGFGLLGHAHEMAHLSRVNLKIHLKDLPWLPGATEYGAKNTFPGGMYNNLEYFSQWVTFSGVSQMMQRMLWSPETSGGLLAAVNPKELSLFAKDLPEAKVIGEILPGDGHIEVLAKSQ